jgi:hypothetical protein
VKVIRIHPKRGCVGFSAENCPYADQVLLVRPDSYIAASSPLDGVPPSFVLTAMELGKGH